ncbi:MAG TPA: hypothetical protein VFX76_17750 [Roseiflexaceae bacterium]|nr:hypothetical protein [Roseiflexaceae bacterium]
MSRAQASDVTLIHFLAEQSDVIVLLCGGPALWHLARKRITARYLASNGDIYPNILANASHQLRQVFTVLLLGLGMIGRKLEENKPEEIPALLRRLQQVTRTGAYILAALDEPKAAEPKAASNNNGRHLQYTENGLHP